MHWIRLFIAIAILSFGATRPAHAADATDHWWNPGESGWGLSVTHQDNIAYIVIFAYGSDRKPLWLAATATRYGADMNGNPGFAGPLYVMSGPPLGGVFDPAAVTGTPVGRAVLQLDSPASASLHYDVNGLAVTKAVRRFTFRNHDWRGTYRAVQRANYDNCTPGFEPTFNYDDGMIDVDQDGTKFTLAFDGRKAVCTYTGTYRQDGRVGSVTGKYQCTGGPQGDFVMSNIETNSMSISGLIKATHPQCGLMSQAFSGFSLDAQ